MVLDHSIAILFYYYSNAISSAIPMNKYYIFLLNFIWENTKMSTHPTNLNLNIANYEPLSNSLNQPTSLPSPKKLHNLE